MPFNGSGTFNRIYSWVTDDANGIPITASRMDTDTNDITANGLSDCITRDGQSLPTANLPMGNFRHTSVGNAVARTDYLATGQFQDIGPIFSVATNTANALQAAFAPTITVLADGMRIYVRALLGNTTTTPTLKVDSTSAVTITKDGGQPLAVGDIYGPNHVLHLIYDLANNHWELQNPASNGFATGKSVASASTTDLGAVGSNFIQITGNNTITNFGSSASLNNQIYLITTTGFPEIDSGSGIVVLGSGGIKMQPGDYALLAYGGSGNWVMFAYFPASGFPGVSVQNTQNNNYTLVLGDAARTILHTSGSAHTWTLPTNAAVPWPLGTTLIMLNTGAGAVTVARGVGGTLRLAGSATDANRTLSQWGLATFMKWGNDDWIANGVGIA